MRFAFFDKGADESGDERAAKTAAKAQRIAQELRRPRREAKRLAVRAPENDDEVARQQLERTISEYLPGGRLALAITDNRYTMISVKRERGPLYRVRLHHMFVEAPPPIGRSLARYIALNDPGASRELGEFIDQHQQSIRQVIRRTASPVTVVTRGLVHDLQEIYDDLNQRYFGQKIAATITWGSRGGKPRRRRNSIKMGSYSVEDRLIRIHPALDRRFVPRFFLEWIVFHEMLHQVHDIPVVEGRRQFHTPEFLADERRFEHYPRARVWERENLDRILNF
jgi:hypothetical protein